MLQYRLYGGKSLPAGPQGFIKASANIGSVIGQFLFGEHGRFHSSMVIESLSVHQAILPILLAEKPSVRSSLK